MNTIWQKLGRRESFQSDNDHSAKNDPEISKEEKAKTTI